MEAKAIARHIRIAPRKIRIVADLVRGKKHRRSICHLEVHSESWR